MKTNPFMARYAETDKHASGPTASSCLALHPLAARFLEKSPRSIARLVLIGLFIATGPAAAQPVEPAHECIGFFDEHLITDNLVYFAGPEGIVGSDDNYSKGLECPEIIKQGSSEEIVLYRLTGTPGCDSFDPTINTKVNINQNSNTVTSDMTSIGLVWCAEYDNDDLQWRSGYNECKLDGFGGLDAGCEPIGTVVNVNRQGKIKAGSIVVSRTVNGQAINISSIDITESDTSTFMVHLDSNPTVDVTLSITTDIPNSDVVVSPSTLTFTSGGRTNSGGNYGTAQEITITPMMDNIVDPEVEGFIILTPTGGSNYDGTQRRLSLNIGDDDDSGLKITSGGAPVGNRTIITDRGQDIVFQATISSNPSSPFSVSLSHTLSDSIRFIPSTINFSSSNWQSPQTFTLNVPDEADKEAETGNIIVKAIGAPSEYHNIDRTIPIIISTGDGSGGGGDKPTDPNDPKTWVVQTYALAIPPVTAQDQAIVRLRCLQDDQCPVYLDCQAQTDGTKFEGRMGAPIPAWGSTTLNARDIVDITGGSWENKGRLSCSIRSHSKVAALVWTRSGDGVLVNNSAAIMSREIRNAAGGSYFQAEIASIPSPLSADGSNIRILCAATGGRSCSETSVSCFDDEGVRRDGNLGIIERNTVHHLQTQALAEIIAYQWQQGSLMSCEMRSDQPFSVQILTRTGGGGALVNNSASGG